MGINYNIKNEVETLNTYNDEARTNEVSEEKTCIDCDSPFTITQGEVNYFIQHQLVTPKRCKPCRTARKANPLIRASEAPRTPIFPAERVDITCAHCGRDSNVPFKPFPGAPVYCKVCWVGVKNIGAPINYTN